MTCYQHPSMGAATRCTNCGEEICAVCITHVGDRIVCRDCADVLRSQPAPAAVEPQPEALAPDDAVATKPAVREPARVPAPVTTSAITTVPRPQPPAVPDAGTGGPRAKESLLSAALSLILPGAGQAYNGQVVKGLILAALYIGSIAVILGGAVVSAWYARAACLCCMPLFVMPLVVLVYAIYDAYGTAEKINNHEAVRDWL